MNDLLKENWRALAALTVAAETGVEPGKMMSADALTWRGKVFAFHSTKGGREGLGCRIGREIDPDALGLIDWQHLAPFKTKPPMKDWIVVGCSDLARWPELIKITLNLAKQRNLK